MDPIREIIVNFLDDLFVCKSNKYNDSTLHDKLVKKTRAPNVNPISLLLPIESIDVMACTADELKKVLVFFNGKLRGKEIVPSDNVEFEMFMQHLLVLKTISSIDGKSSSTINETASTSSEITTTTSATSTATSSIAETGPPNSPTNVPHFVDTTMATVQNYLTTNESNFNVNLLGEECLSMMPLLLNQGISAEDVVSSLSSKSQLSQLISEMLGSTSIMDSIRASSGQDQSNQ